MGKGLIWLVCGMVFSATLALIVGQRLSAEGMAVVIGVIAGIGASIPTSLLVVWFMGQNSNPRAAAEAAPAPTPRILEMPEPRIVVMPAPQPQPQPTYANVAGYGPQSYAGYAPTPAGGYTAAQALPARRFTVIGGEGMIEEPAFAEESVTWQR